MNYIEKILQNNIGNFSKITIYFKYFIDIILSDITEEQRSNFSNRRRGIKTHGAILTRKIIHSVTHTHSNQPNQTSENKYIIHSIIQTYDTQKTLL